MLDEFSSGARGIAHNHTWLAYTHHELLSLWAAYGRLVCGRVCRPGSAWNVGTSSDEIPSTSHTCLPQTYPEKLDTSKPRTSESILDTAESFHAQRVDLTRPPHPGCTLAASSSSGPTLIVTPLTLISQPICVPPQRSMSLHAGP